VKKNIHARKLRVVTPCTATSGRQAFSKSGDWLCGHCHKKVFDLRGMTRKQAQHVLDTQDVACVRMRVDDSGEPVFREEPSRINQTLRPLVMGASLLAACETAQSPQHPSTSVASPGAEQHIPSSTESSQGQPPAPLKSQQGPNPTDRAGQTVEKPCAPSTPSYEIDGGI